MEALLTDTLVSRHDSSTYGHLHETSLVNSHTRYTNSVFFTSRKRPAPVYTDTFFESAYESFYNDCITQIKFVL